MKFSIRHAWLPILPAIALAFLPVHGAFAQTSQNVDRAQMTQAQVQTTYDPGSTTGLEDGHAASSPNDADLGEQEILKRVDKYQPLTASFALPVYWTSNVALVRDGEMSDVIEAPVAALYYEPKITQTLYGLFDVREQLFYYNDNDSFNFGAFDVDAGLTWFLPKMNNLIVRAFYNYDRLTERDSFDAFYENHALIFSAELPIRLGRAQQITFGTGANISMAAEPEAPRRNDYDAYVGYSVNVTRALNVNAVGRLVVRDYYHQNSRVDVSEILALTASYKITKVLSASAMSTLAASQSNHEVFDYEVANVGGVLSLAVKF